MSFADVSPRRETYNMVVRWVVTDVYCYSFYLPDPTAFADVNESKSGKEIQ